MAKRKTTAAGLSKTSGPNDKSSALSAGKVFRRFLPQVFLAGLFFLCGCQTAPRSLFTAAGPGWRVRQGQALWRPQRGAPEFGDDQPLFGPGSVGLDSVDALQLVVALDKTYGLKIADPDAARQILQNVGTMAAAVAQHQESVAGKP
jgi:acyl carrier protein